MTFSPASLKEAEGLLKTANRKDTSERNIENQLAGLLRILGLASESDQAVGSGRADLVLPQQRTIIELKTSRSWQTQQVFKQLADYTKQLAGASEQPAGWLAIATNGLDWLVWSTDRLGQINFEQTAWPKLTVKPGQEWELLAWLNQVLTRQTDLATLPQNPFADLLAAYLDQLRSLDFSRQRQAQLVKQTQFDLWHQQLQAADLLTPGNEQELFLRHTFLGGDCPSHRFDSPGQATCF